MLEFLGLTWDLCTSELDGLFRVTIALVSKLSIRSEMLKVHMIQFGLSKSVMLHFYFFKIQFVKPNLLGTKHEFRNMFINPITNGRYANSTEADVNLMKRRVHVLHSLLEGTVHVNEKNFDWRTFKILKF